MKSNVNANKNGTTTNGRMMAWTTAVLVGLAGGVQPAAALFAPPGSTTTPTQGNLPPGAYNPPAGYPGTGAPGTGLNGAGKGQTGFTGQGSSPAFTGSAMGNPKLMPAVAPGPAISTLGNEKGKNTNVHVDDNQLVDLHVQEEDLNNVLEMLSVQAQRNIIANKDVNAKVTANFYGVTFYQALDAILHANGYGYIEKDNFIFVYTAEQIQQIMMADKKRNYKIFKLSYLNATDAASFVKSLLSEGGQITINGKTAAFPGKTDVPQGQDDYAADATLLVFDYEENVQAIEEMLKQLDTKPAQVLVEATILQTQLTESNALGVDFALINDMNFNDFIGVGGPLHTVDSMIVNDRDKLTGGASGDHAAATGHNNLGLTSTAGNTGGPGTMKFGFIKDNVGVFLNVLDEVTDTTVLSNPKILALNRQAARVLVGKRVGYLNSTSTDTSTTQTVEFLDTGTQLHFRPFVSQDGTIRMELKPQVSSALIRDIKNSSGSTVTVPDELTNELTTNVMVRDGESVVLGGLFSDSTTTTRRQVPFLGDLPILGNAFKGKENDVARNEIIFLITPSIVNDSALIATGKRGQEAVNRALVGAREGLLPFSRDRMGAEMLVEAQRLANEGKKNEALHKIEQSLTMNPLQPDAISLREQLTGQRASTPMRSMLEEVMGHEAMKKADAAGVPKPTVKYGMPTPATTTPNSAAVVPAATSPTTTGTTPAAVPTTEVKPVTAPTTPAKDETPATKAPSPSEIPSDDPEFDPTQIPVNNPGNTPAMNPDQTTPDQTTPDQTPENPDGWKENKGSSFFDGSTEFDLNGSSIFSAPSGEIQVTAPTQDVTKPAGTTGETATTDPTKAKRHGALSGFFLNLFKNEQAAKATTTAKTTATTTAATTPAATTNTTSEQQANAEVQSPDGKTDK